MNESNETLIMRGLDGANPLAFLASLGVLRVLTRADPDLSAKLAWCVSEGAWRPRLQVAHRLQDDQFAQRVFDACRATHCRAALELGDDLNLEPAAYRSFVVAAAASARSGELAQAEFATSFACEVTVNENGSVQDTAFRTMSGAGHQHFLKTMRNLIIETQVPHIRRALFQRWDYGDPVRNMALRWDPADDSRYALRWSDPSGDPERQRGGAMWGANRLAIEGLPLFPVMPTVQQLETTGFRTAGSRGTFLTWPIWEGPVGLDEVRSLLAMQELQAETPDRKRLSARGVVEVFRAQRLTVSKFRNLTRGTPA
jgi:hypothetical protein